MRIAIAGASSFIGRELTAQLLAEDAEVVWLSRRPIASRWNAAVKHALRDSRIGTNRAIVRALADAHAADPNRERVLVSASGIGYYGDRGDTILDESTEAGVDFLGQLAAEREAAALEAARAGCARVVCVRTGLALKIILGEVAPYMLFSQRATPVALTASGFEFAHPHLAGALTDVTSEGPGHARV